MARTPKQPKPPKPARPVNLAEMPFLDHLEELRRRLFYCAIAVAIGLAVAAALFLLVPNFDIVDFLAIPVHRAMPNLKLIARAPGELFELKMNAAFVVAMIVASPVIIYQLWGFISPALHTHEKKIVTPVIFGIVVLFVSGIVVAFELIVPRTLEFLLGVHSESVTVMPDVKEYLGLVITICIGFGAAFELPIVIMALTAIGLVKPAFLAKYRKFAVVGGLIVGGFITPDPTAMFYIGVPLYGLYELSILLSRMVFRWREGRDKDGSDPDDPPPQTRIDDPERREPLRLGAPPA